MTQTIRFALWLMFFSGIIVSWVILYQMSVGMGLNWMGQPSPDIATLPLGSMDALPMDAPEAMPMDGNASPVPMAGMDASPGMEMTPAMDMDMDMAAMNRFMPLFAMWTLMMAAMMLPTLVPTLTTYDRLITSADGTRAGWVGVLAGYFIVWIGVAALIAGLQLLLLASDIIDVMGAATSTWIAGGLLIAVGAFQFSRAKEVCHGVCHAPMAYFLGHWRTGLPGGARMGLVLGVYCAGCCWGFMALGFAGGVMSLLWMGLATILMVIEKLPQLGHYVTRPIGFALIAGGLGVLASPLVAG